MQVSKRDAADRLLEQAVAALLDRADPISAIVLGGSAEDIYWGLLGRLNPDATTARDEIAHHVIAVAARLYPEDPPMTLTQARKAIRASFNWLRHNNEEDEPQTRDFDAVQEAAAIIERAMENLFRITGADHPRMVELLAYMRGQ